MTIGDFRKITENYPDDARIVHWLGHEKLDAVEVVKTPDGRVFIELDAQVSALSSS